MAAITGTNSGSDTIIQDLIDKYKRPTDTVKAGNVLGKDEFMKLLITQLKNQDPLSPMDNTQMISEQAQFSSLEQMTNLNKNFESFITSMQQDKSAYAVSYLGTTVSAVQPAAEAGGEPVTITGTVSSIVYRDGEAKLVVNGTEVALTELASVTI